MNQKFKYNENLMHNYSPHLEILAYDDNSSEVRVCIRKDLEQS